MLIYGIISCGYALLVLFVVTDEPEDINSANTNDDNKHAPSSKMPYRKVWQAIFSSFYTYILFCGFFVTVMTKGILGTYGGLYLIEVIHLLVKLKVIMKVLSFVQSKFRQLHVQLNLSTLIK